MQKKYALIAGVHKKTIKIFKIRIRFVNLGKYIYISLPLSVFSVIPIRDIE